MEGCEQGVTGWALKTSLCCFVRRDCALRGERRHPVGSHWFMSLEEDLGAGQTCKVSGPKPKPLSPGQGQPLCFRL